MLWRDSVSTKLCGSEEDATEGGHTHLQIWHNSSLCREQLARTAYAKSNKTPGQLIKARHLLDTYLQSWSQQEKAIDAGKALICQHQNVVNQIIDRQTTKLRGCSNLNFIIANPTAELYLYHLLGLVLDFGHPNTCTNWRIYWFANRKCNARPSTSNSEQKTVTRPVLSMARGITGSKDINCASWAISRRISISFRRYKIESWDDGDMQCG